MNASLEDLAERIDASFGPGPDSPPSLDALLARGRRARRRRRVAVGGLAAAAAAAVAFGSLILAGHGDDRVRQGEYVASPTASTSPSQPATPSPDPTSSPALDRMQQLRLMDRAVSFGDSGTPTLAPGATILEEIDNPYDSVAPAWSIALRVGYRGVEFWTADYGPGDGSMNGAKAGPDPTGSFARFVAEQDPGDATTSFVGPDVWPDVVRLDPVRMVAGSDRLTARTGFTVTEQRAAVSVGSAWADPAASGEDSSAALVRAADGTSYFVLARRFDDKPAQYVTVPRTGNGADLDAFVDLARQRYRDAR